jgi:hypothetical protein
MPLTGTYSWRQTPLYVHLSVPLKGTSPKDVDVYVARRYVKINFSPYLSEIDLLHGVHDASAAQTAVVRDGQLELRLTKLQPASWPSLTVEGLDTAALRARRAEDVEEKRKRDVEAAEQAQVRRSENERKAVRVQMQVDDGEHATLDHLKAEEKHKAEVETYKVLEQLKQQESNLKQQPLPKKATVDGGAVAVGVVGTSRGVASASSVLAARRGGGDAAVDDDDDSAPASKPKQRAAAADDDDDLIDDTDIMQDLNALEQEREQERRAQQAAAAARLAEGAIWREEEADGGAGTRSSSNNNNNNSSNNNTINTNNNMSSALAGGAGSKKPVLVGSAVASTGSNTAAAADDDDDQPAGANLDEDAVYVPQPRQTGGVVKVAFTKRFFKTPLRESKRSEEEDWIAKNQRGLSQHPDARDIAERDPFWLKGKGDDFFKAKDYSGAINACVRACVFVAWLVGWCWSWHGSPHAHTYTRTRAHTHTRVRTRPVAHTLHQPVKNYAALSVAWGE